MIKIFSRSLTIFVDSIIKLSISLEIKTVSALLSLIIDSIISLESRVLTGTGITPALRHPQKIIGNSI